MALQALGLAMILVSTGFIMWVMRERALIAGLRGYADYTSRVRYRLLPGLW